MSKLKNIKLNDHEVKRILVSSYFSCGSEAVVCRTNNPHTLYKIFTKGGLEPIPMSDNKLRKIEEICNLQLENCVQPLGTISNNGILIGYEMTYDPNERRFSPSHITRNELIRRLKQVHDILRYFETKDITYGDVDFQNILVNTQTGNIKFCDIDNMRIRKYPIDFICKSLTEYYDIRGIDQRVDAYMHNLFSLKCLNLDFDSYDSNSIREEFTEPAVRIVESMHDLEVFTGEYIIKYVKK